MSLFENDEYQWRETYFVLFDAAKLPEAEEMAKLLRKINANYQIQDLRAREDGKFESLTLFSADDYAAMDLTCVTGEEVTEQVTDLAKELAHGATAEEMVSIRKIPKCTARLEIYHFEQLVFLGSTNDDEFDDFMDPGSLLVVLEKIARLCDGIVVDPQSNTVL